MSTARHLFKFVGQRVDVSLDDRAASGVLVKIAGNGCYVLLDGDDRPTRVAEWRISGATA
jgi:hypothetical protein